MGICSKNSPQSPEEIANRFDDRRAALTHCLGKLSEKELKLVTARYESDQSFDALAKTFQRPVGSLRVSLHRVRAALRRCIEIQLTPNP